MTSFVILDDLSPNGSRKLTQRSLAVLNFVVHPLVNWLCWFLLGQQDGSGGGDGIAGGHTRHSRLCGHPVGESCHQIAAHGVRASGTLEYFHPRKKMISVLRCLF